MDRASTARIGRCQSRQHLRVAAAIAEGLNIVDSTNAPEKIRVGINGERRSSVNLQEEAVPIHT